MKRVVIGDLYGKMKVIELVDEKNKLYKCKCNSCESKIIVSVKNLHLFGKDNKDCGCSKNRQFTYILYSKKTTTAVVGITSKMEYITEKENKNIKAIKVWRSNKKSIIKFALKKYKRMGFSGTIYEIEEKELMKILSSF